MSQINKYQPTKLRTAFLIAAGNEAKKEEYTVDVQDKIVDFSCAIALDHMISAKGVDASVALYYKHHNKTDKDPAVETAALALKQVITTLEQ